MPPPIVLEVDVHIGVVRRLEWQSIRGPILPPVVVPLKARVEVARLAVKKSRPRGPGLLVGATQEAEVVYLETRRTARVGRLKKQMLAANLAESEFLGVATERRAGAIEWQIRVGTMVLVHAVVLKVCDHRLAAVDRALVEGSRNFVTVLEELVAKIHGADVRARGEIWGRPLIHAAIHSCQHRAESAVSAAQILACAHNREIRPRLICRVAR